MRANPYSPNECHFMKRLRLQRVTVAEIAERVSDYSGIERTEASVRKKILSMGIRIGHGKKDGGKKKATMPSNKPWKSHPEFDPAAKKPSYRPELSSGVLSAALYYTGRKVPWLAKQMKAASGMRITVDTVRLWCRWGAPMEHKANLKAILDIK